MTEFDAITKSPEKLSEFLEQLISYALLSDEKGSCPMHLVTLKCPLDTDCKKCIATWLNAEHK